MTKLRIATSEQTSSFPLSQLEVRSPDQLSRSIYRQSTGTVQYVKKASQALMVSTVLTVSSPSSSLPVSLDRLQSRNSISESTTSALPNVKSSATTSTPAEHYISARPALINILARLQHLEYLGLHGNAYGEAVPSQDSIVHARSWVIDMYEDTHHVGQWLQPLITVDTDGNVVFEWWNSEKKLAVYVSHDTIEYIKVWGTNIFTEMEDGVVISSNQQRDLWQWLVG